METKCKHCSENATMSVLASRNDNVKVTDPKGFVIATNTMDKEKPVIKSFFWGVGDDREFGSA